MTSPEALLQSLSSSETEQLFQEAAAVRKQHMGDGILLRGIVEFGSYCKQACAYCGINRTNSRLQRYRLTEQEIISAVQHITEANIRTVVLQSGEDSGLDPEWLAQVIRTLKSRFDISITLSIGEYDKDVYALWKKAGADRYLLKIETTSATLYETLHPGMSLAHRLHCLDDLQALGYQTGCGIIVGLPGQTLESLVQDILFFKDRDFDMIGIGPFIAHDDTPLAHLPNGDALLTLKVLALTRIVTKNSHLPATTALGSLGKDWRREALQVGANVLMPNFTPAPYKQLYELYPGKRCVKEQGEECTNCMEGLARSIGRHLDYSHGNSVKQKSSALLSV